MTRDEMVEAGARALYDARPWVDYTSGSPRLVPPAEAAEADTYDVLRDAAERVLLATVPGIMAGTDWERLARVLCEADTLAPSPDAPIIWKGKSCRAWEARVPMVRAMIAAYLNQRAPSDVT